MDGINDILSSLSDEDIENLKSAAAELFGSQPQESEAPSPSGAPDISKLLDNAQMMAKLTSIMGAMNRQPHSSDRGAQAPAEREEKKEG